MTALSLDLEPPATDERAAFAVAGAERLENASQALVWQFGDVVGASIDDPLVVFDVVCLHRGDQGR
jgi:hypothetical protein